MSKPSRAPSHRRSPAAEALPARPDLDQLRRQARELLARLRAGDPDAAQAFITHLPQARERSARQVLAAGYRLADALSAVARRSGFASWPALARHVELLRALEGEWAFASLEVDGSPVPAQMLGGSRILIDGDRFRTESPEATYEGEFRIDVEQLPHTIDIEFVEGPEAGRWSLGLFALDGDTLTICLGLAGAKRPAAFRTSRGSQHALEVLRRASKARPAGVTGGTRGRGAPPARPATIAAPADGFHAAPSSLDEPLSGTWRAEELVRDGKPLPRAFLSAGQRVAEGNEVRVTFGGQVMVHARVRYDAAPSPAHVDYLYLTGDQQGQVALGIVALDGDELRVNMAPPGASRPTDWTSSPGSGRTFSRWRRR